MQSTKCQSCVDDESWMMTVADRSLMADDDAPAPNGHRTGIGRLLARLGIAEKTDDVTMNVKTYVVRLIQ